MLNVHKIIKNNMDNGVVDWFILVFLKNVFIVPIVCDVNVIKYHVC